MSGLRQLAERYGTPLYVYDLAVAEASLCALRAALPDPVGLFYSLKANPHPALVAALRTASGGRLGAEVSSVGELGAALAGGADPGECLYTGPGKTKAELTQALSSGITMFSVESAAELRRLAALGARLGVRPQILLRVNGIAGGSGSIRMSGMASQFGVDIARLIEEFDRYRVVDGVELLGLHLFSLSNAKDERSLLAELERGIATAARIRAETGFAPRILDIGGGFAAAYATPGARPEYPLLDRRLRAALDAEFPGWTEGTPRVLCESGRHLVAACGTLLCSVVDVKRSHGRTFVVLDAGINALGGMSALGRLLSMRAVPVRASATSGTEAAEQDAVLVGPLCTPADVLARDTRVPADLAPSDLLVFPNVGAYGLTASLVGFLGRPLPAEVVVRGDEVCQADRLSLVRSPVHPEPGGG